MPPGEVTSLLQHCQDPKPADTDPSGQTLHGDLILEHRALSKIGFHCACSSRSSFWPVPGGLHGSENPPALSGRQVTFAWPRAGTVTPGRGSCDASQRCHQDTAPGAGKAACAPSPGQGISNDLPSGQLLKIRFYLSYSFTPDQQQQIFPSCAPEFPIPRAAHLVTSGMRDGQGPAKYPDPLTDHGERLLP